MRRNIGLLIDDMDAVFTKEAVKGAELGAIAIDANMYIFPGMYLDDLSISTDHMPYEYQYNTLFQFANNKQLDILYIMMGMIGGRVSDEQQRLFLEQFLGIPVVTLYTNSLGYNSMIFDNQIAFKQGIRHIIEDHNAKNIGYVSGPKTNVDALERLDAYKKALEETQIPYRDNYVIYGNFEESTQPLIKAFVETHPELDALVFANDRMARGGYEALKQLQLQPGRDILIVSFDNSIFAATMNPPLTTVEANAAELSYKAITNIETFLSTAQISNLRVNTHLVHRASCGCPDFDYNSLSEQLLMHKISDPAFRKDMMAIIYKYLFGDYVEGDRIRQIKDDLSVFLQLLYELLNTDELQNVRMNIKKIFTQLLHEPLFNYTTVELYTNVIAALQSEFKNLITDSQKLNFVLEIFASMYQEIAINNFQISQGQRFGIEQISKVINAMNMDIAQASKNDTTNYKVCLSRLSSIGVKSSYLYTFLHPISHPRNSGFSVPENMLFRAYSRDDNAYGIPVSKQIIPSFSVLVNNKTPKSRRYTMVVSALFSQEDLFGILMCETSLEHFQDMATVSIHISTTLKTLYLLEQQRAIQKRLQKNLDIMSQDNLMLNEISKTDQLTGLYNRWGFMDHVQSIISNPLNIDKEIMVLYADMDNLKKINDEYGHDDGDFALKETASILKEAFRNTDVVSRFGGDEFVAFAMLGISDYEKIMKLRIADITERHNMEIQKPYRVEMSTGICEVKCSPDLNIEEILEIADKKLYEEKKAKKTKQLQL